MTFDFFWKPVFAQKISIQSAKTKIPENEHIIQKWISFLHINS